MIQLKIYFFLSKSKTHNECSKMIKVLNASKKISLDPFNDLPTTPRVDFKYPNKKLTESHSNLIPIVGFVILMFFLKFNNFDR